MHANQPSDPRQGLSPCEAPPKFSFNSSYRISHHARAETSLNSRRSQNKFCFLVPLSESSQGYSDLVHLNLVGTHLLQKLSTKGENTLDGKELVDLFSTGKFNHFGDGS